MDAKFKTDACVHIYPLNCFHKVGERLLVGKIEAYTTTGVHLREQHLSRRHAVEACQWEFFISFDVNGLLNNERRNKLVLLNYILK